MGYPRVPMASLWPNKGNEANWKNIWAKTIFFFKKILYVIPSALLSFLPFYCHSFRILSFLPNIVIPSELLSIILKYCYFEYLSAWIAPVPPLPYTVCWIEVKVGVLYARQCMPWDLLLTKVLNIFWYFKHQIMTKISSEAYLKHYWRNCLQILSFFIYFNNNLFNYVSNMLKSKS